MTGSIISLILALKKNKLYFYILSAFICSLLSICRSEYILLSFVMLAFMFFSDKRAVAEKYKKYVLFILVFCVVTGLWTFRNWTVFGKFIPVSKGNLGLLMYNGTYEGYYSKLNFTDFPSEIFSDEKEKKEVYKNYHRLMFYQFTGTADVLQYDSYFMRKTKDRIKKNPFNVLGSYLLKSPRLWYQNYSSVYSVKEPPGVYYTIYFIFAVIGFAAVCRSDCRFALLCGAVFLYLNFIFLPLHIEPRYGIPFLPVLITFSGTGIWIAGSITVKLIRRYFLKERIGV